MVSVNKNYFEFLHIIGRGGFGKVWKVKLKKTNEHFALKEMSKTKIIDRRSETSIMSERTLLSKLNNPFIVNMYFAFQDYSNLYLVMDLLSGGDLRYHLGKKKKFSEKETKFFISNIILALEYIHSKNIIHRDIKPENLVLELNGYLRITDFGVAKINEKDNSHETSGTPGYMAPEVILVQNHSFPSDFFALGVIGYEFMLGYRPYLGRSRKEIKELISCKQARLNEGKIPYSWSLDSADFINKLLKRKPNKRLGFNGIKEIKSHIWMRDINWNALKRKELVAPFIPNSNRENFDKNYCEKIEDLGRATLARYKEYTESELFMDAFKGYTYINIAYLQTKIKKYKNKEEDDKKKEENDINIKKNLLNKKENNKPLLIQTPTSKMKKNNSMVIGENKSTLLQKDKNINNSNSQKNLNIAFDLYKISKRTRNLKQKVKEENKKELFKRMTIDDNIRSPKKKTFYKNNNNNNNKFIKKNIKISNEKEKVRRRAIKISEKINEIKKIRTNYEFNNLFETKKGINKSNSMKKLNINLDLNMNYNYEKIKYKNNKNETKKIKDTYNIKIISKRSTNINNTYNTKNQKILKSSNKRIYSPIYDRNKEIKSISVIVNDPDNRIKKENTDMNKVLNQEFNDKVFNSIKENNNNIEKMQINSENKNQSKMKYNKISNDFNIKEFAKDNYNEPRSKVMLWIQRSHPINQYENKNNKYNTINNNEKTNKINKEINENINTDKSDKKDGNIINQQPKTNLNDEQKEIINKKNLDINTIIRKKNNSNKNKIFSHKKELNSFHKTNSNETIIMDSNDRYKSKNDRYKKQYKSSGNSRRNYNANNRISTKRIHSNKSTSVTKKTKSINTKSPKNTFLVFNTININLGNSQKGKKRITTPKAQVIRTINSSLKNTYFRNDFIFDSMPYFEKNVKDQLKISNNNIILNNVENENFTDIMKNCQHNANKNLEIAYIKSV